MNEQLQKVCMCSLCVYQVPLARYSCDHHAPQTPADALRGMMLCSPVGTYVGQRDTNAATVAVESLHAIGIVASDKKPAAYVTTAAVPVLFTGCWQVLGLQGSDQCC